MSEASSAQHDGDGALEQVPPETEHADEAATSNTADDDMEALRRLLMAPEQERIEVLEQRELTVEDVSKFLPEAVVLRTHQDDLLAQSLGPTIENSLRVSIERDPQPFADALFPIMGPAIRKSIREALRSMLETINRTVESRLSPQAVQWRIEAWRTGLSFSEVVLRHTLQYRVEQVFLIDEEAGLPLQHVVAEDVDAQDSTLVTSMLTALEDFAQDSFGSEDTLDTLAIGELTVWIEQGPQAQLAAVIRGNPSSELRRVMESVIETIHLQFKNELEAFDGDAEPLDGTRPLLESVLVSQYKDKQRRTSPLVWVFLAVAIIAFGLWIFFTVRDRIRWNDYLALLDAEPGLVVTEQGSRGGDWYVQGLRDPLARDPAAVLAETPLDPDDVRGEWAAYQTLDSAFVLQRAIRLLDPPPTVDLRYDGGTLSASGSATGVWLYEARQRAPFLAGISTYDDAAVQDEFQDVIDDMEKQALRFIGGGTTLAAGQETALDSLIAFVQRFQISARDSGRQVRLEILGHVSTEGGSATNLALSQRRAESVRNVLIQRGMSPGMVEAIGTGQPRYEGEETTEEQRAANRSVSFRVVVN